jgi:hypothetical protein
MDSGGRREADRGQVPTLNSYADTRQIDSVVSDGYQSKEKEIGNE